MPDTLGDVSYLGIDHPPRQSYPNHRHLHLEYLVIKPDLASSVLTKVPPTSVKKTSSLAARHRYHIEVPWFWQPPVLDPSSSFSKFLNFSSPAKYNLGL